MICDMLPRRDTKTPSLCAPAFSCRGPHCAPTRPNLAQVPRHPSPCRSIPAGSALQSCIRTGELLEPSGEFSQVPAKAASRRNQHALRAASPRTPTPVLLALLRACSFRLEGEAVAWRFPLGAWLGRSATSCGPLVPRLRNRSVSRRQHPNRSGWKRRTSFPFRNRWHTNEIALRKPVRLTHQSKCNGAGRTSDVFQAQSTDLLWAYTAGPSRVRERVKSGRPLYGEVGKFKDSTGRLKQSTRRCRSSLDLSASAKGPASKISRAPAICCATKMNSGNER